MTTAVGHATDAEVIWDEVGVPHVYGTSDEAVFFGQGYACARDRLAQMHIGRMGAQGRVTELLGAANGANSGVVKLDQWALHTHLYEYATDLYANLDPQTQSALQAYADGVNARIEDLQTKLLACDSESDPDACKKELVSEVLTNFTPTGSGPDLVPDIESFPTADFPRWEPEDCIALWEYWTRRFNHNPMLPNRFRPLENEANNICGTGCSAHTYVGSNQPIDEGGTVVEETHVDQATRNAITAYAQANGLDLCSPGNGGGAAARFSHGCAVSGDMTQSGAAIVWADPQVRVGHPSLFHETHIVNTDSVAGFNARGISMVGCPGFFLAYSDAIAWAGASLGMDAADLIKVTPGASTGTYKRDCDGTGVSDVSFDTESYSILDSDLTSLENGTRKSTCFGPVVTPLIDQSCCTVTSEFVLRTSANFLSERHSLQASLLMPKAESAAELRERAKYWVAPPMHCVFGDDEGDIGYTPLAAVPLREEPCRADEGIDALGGSVNGRGFANRDWQEIVPFDFLPWAIKDISDTNDAGPDVVMIANNRPAGSWYDVPMLLKNPSDTSTNRWVRMWKYFNIDNVQTSYTTEDIGTLALDPIAVHREQIARLTKHIRDDNANVSLTTTLHAGDIQDIIDWYGSGAESDAGDSDFTGISALKNLSIKSTWGELELLYGEGKAGGFALLRELAQRDLSSTADPLDPAVLEDAEIVLLVNDALNAIANALGGPNPPSLQLSYGPFEHFKQYPDAETLHTNSAEKTNHDIPAQDLVCQDIETLWSAVNKIYTHVVDMDAPGAAAVMHPLGNHEDFEEPELGEHDRDGIVDAWKSGVSGPNVVSQMNGNVSGRGSLAKPGPTNPDGLLADSDAVAGAGVTGFQTPLVTYYGASYPGWNPQRGISLELQSAVTEVEPGDSITIRLSGVDNGSNWSLRLGTEKTNVLKTDGLNRTYVGLLCTEVTGPGGIQTYNCLAEYVSPTGGDTFSVTIPAGVVDDFVYLQATGTAPSDPNEPAPEVSSSGMAIRITQP